MNNPVEDNCLSYQQVIGLVNKLTEIPEPDKAYRLLGYSEQEYNDLKQIVSPEIDQSALGRIGFTVYTDRNMRRRREENNYGYAQMTVPSFFSSRSDVIENVLGIIGQATPSGRSTAVILSDHPDSGLFDALEPEHLLLFMSPRNRVVNQPPSSDWQEIPGGWRRGRRILAKQSFLLATGNNGQLRYSAAQRAKRVEQLAELCAGAWPETGANQQQLAQAAAELQKISQCREILEEIAAYRRESFPDFAEYRRHLLHNQQRIVADQQRLERLQQQIDEAQARSDEIIERITIGEPQTILDSRAKLNQVSEDLRALQEVRELDYVTSAELTTPFLKQVELQVATTITAADSTRPITVFISQEGVRFQPAVDLDLESRIMAIAEKFSRGQFSSALRMACQPLLTSQTAD